MPPCALGVWRCSYPPTEHKGLAELSISQGTDTTQILGKVSFTTYNPGLYLNILLHSLSPFPRKGKGGERRRGKGTWFNVKRIDVRTLEKEGKNSFDIRESQGHLSIHLQDARTAAGR